MKQIRGNQQTRSNLSNNGKEFCRQSLRDWLILILFYVSISTSSLYSVNKFYKDSKDMIQFSIS